MCCFYATEWESVLLLDLFPQAPRDVGEVSQVDEMSTQKCEITHHRQAVSTIKDECCPILNDKKAQLHYTTRSETGRWREGQGLVANGFSAL